MLTQERLKEVLHYFPRTGIFRWKVNIFRRRHKGKIAGGVSGHYITIGIDGTQYYAHRLAILYMTGEWPKNQTDHKNRNKLDNKFSNLRDVSTAKNRQNRILREGQGVCWDKMRERWKASIQVEGKMINLGRFTSRKKAMFVRKFAEKQYEFFP
jgi:hypothetical protein